MARPRRTVAVWIAGTLAWVLGMTAVRPLFGGDPILVVAQATIELAPGPVATWAIESFEKQAQTLLVVSVVVTVFAIGTVAGVVWTRVDIGTRRRRQAAVGLGAGLLASTAGGFYVAGGGISPRWLLGTVLALVPPGAVWWASASATDGIGRRRALRRMGGAAGTVVVGAGLARLFGGRAGDDGINPGQDVASVAEKRATGTTTPAATATATDDVRLRNRETTEGVVISHADVTSEFGFDFEGMPALVESATDHYVVDKNVSAPTVDADEWSLTVRGAVETEATYTFEELVEHPGIRELTLTMVCISNPVGGDLVSTTDWLGIPVATLLADAGVEPGAVDVVTRAADGYSEAIPWRVLSDREDILLAIGMDGQTLPVDHGFPARLLVPGRYGMKSTKWVTGIEIATDDHEAYWEARGWDETAVVNTLSYVRAVQRRGDRVAIGGIAYAGTRGIERVEVSVDGGGTWYEATLEAPAGSHTRRRWRYVLGRPDRGPLDVVVRATDGTGQRQTSSYSPPHPGGSTGWHSVTVSL